MSNILINNGVISTSIIRDSNYLVNNFTESRSLNDWTFGENSFSNGIVSLTGTAPAITSKTFTVGSNDIVVFEFTVSLPTPSTSSDGLYLGTKYGQNTYEHSVNYTTHAITWDTTTGYNPYFIWSYNTTDETTFRTYILGYNITQSEVPLSFFPVNRNFNIIQLTGTDTTTNIRAGYNSGNSSMVINFSNPKIYKYTTEKHEDSDKIQMNNYYLHAVDFIEK